MTPSEERGRYAIAGVQGSSAQSVGPDGQPKRQLFDFGSTNDKRSRDRRRKKVQRLHLPNSSQPIASTHLTIVHVFRKVGRRGMQRQQLLRGQYCRHQ